MKGYAMSDSWIDGHLMSAYDERNGDVEPDAEEEPEEEQPDWQKPCGRCGETITRWRGMTYVYCNCGAEHNAGGQLLRDDWRGNSSTWDEDVSDLDGYEIQHAGDE